MAKWKPYKIKRQKAQPAVSAPSLRPPGKPDEYLTGFIGSMAASDIEERSNRSLGKYKVGLSFRTQFLGTDPPHIIYGGGGRNQLNSVEADFFGQLAGSLIAVQVDGEFAHKTNGQREHDKVQDTKLMEALRQLGGGQVIRIPHYYLEDQQQSDMTWQQVLNGRTKFA